MPTIQEDLQFVKEKTKNYNFHLTHKFVNSATDCQPWDGMHGSPANAICRSIKAGLGRRVKEDSSTYDLLLKYEHNQFLRRTEEGGGYSTFYRDWDWSKEQYTHALLGEELEYHLLNKIEESAGNLKLSHDIFLNPNHVLNKIFNIYVNYLKSDHPHMAEIAEKLKIVAKIRQITHQPENISGALQNVKNILSLNKECIDIHTNKLWTCFCNSILFILTAPIRLFCIKPDYKLHSLGEKFRVEIDNRLKP